MGRGVRSRFLLQRSFDEALAHLGWHWNRAAGDWQWTRFGDDLERVLGDDWGAQAEPTPATWQCFAKYIGLFRARVAGVAECLETFGNRLRWFGECLGCFREYIQRRRGPDASAFP